MPAFVFPFFLFTQTSSKPEPPQTTTTKQTARQTKPKLCRFPDNHPVFMVWAMNLSQQSLKSVVLYGPTWEHSPPWVHSIKLTYSKMLYTEQTLIHSLISTPQQLSLHRTWMEIDFPGALWELSTSFPSVVSPLLSKSIELIFSGLASMRTQLWHRATAH